MAAIVFLIVGLLCATISRILLLIVALDISVWWALGVFLPFGPLFFRLSYPEAASGSRMFRLATLSCVSLYLALGPGALFSHQRHISKQTKLASAPPAHYALEPSGQALKGAPGSTGPKTDAIASLEERVIANAREFERLRGWSEALRLRKRDLLHSDTEGNLAYNRELAQYNAALDRANAEKDSLGALSK